MRKTDNKQMKKKTELHSVPLDAKYNGGNKIGVHACGEGAGKRRHHLLLSGQGRPR